MWRKRREKRVSIRGKINGLIERVAELKKLIETEIEESVAPIRERLEEVREDCRSFGWRSEENDDKLKEHEGRIEHIENQYITQLHAIAQHAAELHAVTVPLMKEALEILKERRDEKAKTQT